MPFLFAIVFLGWANLLASLRSLRARRATMGMLHYLAIVPMIAGVFDAFYLSPANTHGVPGDAVNWIPLATALFGVASMLLFGAKYWQAVRAKEDTSGAGWRSGLSLVCIVAGLYLVAVSIDHWTYFSDSERAGNADAIGLGVKDVQCDRMVLVRLESETASYRCPKSISLGVMAAAPFVPWPSYVAGQSVQLKKQIESLMATTGAAGATARPAATGRSTGVDDGAPR